MLDLHGPFQEEMAPFCCVCKLPGNYIDRVDCTFFASSQGSSTAVLQGMPAA